MASLGFTASAITNNRTSGFTSVNDEWSGNAETLTQIRDGIFRMTPFASKRSIGTERAHGFLAYAEWKFLLASYANVILLPSSSTGGHTTNINFIGGDNAVFGNATVGDNGGLKWKLVINGDADSDRFIQMQVQRAGVYTGAAAANFDSDALWGSFTPAAPAAFWTGTAKASSGTSSFEIRATDTYESLGRIKDVNFTAELMCDEDSEKRYVPRNIHIEYEVSIMDFTAASMAVLDSYHDLASVDHKFTFMDGLIFTPVDQLGGLIEVLIEGDSDKNVILKAKGSGDMLTSAFAALWSQAA
jgi:hypothetical protein